MTVIVGIIVISYAKELISELWDWAANGTLIIDTRNRKLNVSNIPFSTREVIVISDSGVKIFPRESTTKDVVIETVNGALSSGKT